MDAQQIGVRIVFDGLTRAESSKAVQGLRQAVLGRISDDVAATIDKDDPDSQDPGTALVLQFASSAATAVAQGIRAYLARWANQRDRITITSIHGTTIVATGEPARRLDAAMLLRAANSASVTAERSTVPQTEVHGSRNLILFLAANPIGPDPIALDREARAIKVELEGSGRRDCFELITRWAVEPQDLLRELRRLKPTVVHFSGHRSQRVVREQVSCRDVVAEPDLHGDDTRSGLYFQGPDGQPRLVSSAALEEAFGVAGASVKLVVLSTCYSDVQAKALLAHVDCVVGTVGSICDDAARNFAIGFYGGLGDGESVAVAYKHGRAAISLEGLPDGECPQLQVRVGVDADRFVLAAHRPALRRCP